MAVIVMCDKDTLGAFVWSGSEKDKPVYIYKAYEGCVVAEREANYYDDSDFYCTVYDAASDSFKEIMFASTRGWSYPCYGTSVDADADLSLKYLKHLDALRAERAVVVAAAEAKRPAKGKRVKLSGLTKRSKAFAANGKEGVVVWVGERRSKYGTWSYGVRVGVLPDGAAPGSAVFVDSKNVEVLSV